MDDLFEGHGTLVWRNGSVYSGEFREGLMWGDCVSYENVGDGGASTFGK